MPLYDTSLAEDLLQIKSTPEPTLDILRDLERLKQEQQRVGAGYDSELMRLLLARITLNSTYQFIVLLDTEGRVIVPTYTAFNAVGATSNEIIGHPFWEGPWWLVGTESTLRESFHKALLGEFIRYNLDVLIGINKDRRITLDFNLNPLRDRDGNVVFVVAEGRDVTEQRQLERELSRQKEELTQLDKLKTQFFVNISHQFRAPLTLTLGPLEEALSEVESVNHAIQRKRLEIAQRNILRLLKMVNQLLDIFAIEESRISPSYQLTDLARLTSELAGMFSPVAEQAKIALVVDLQPLPEPLYIDRHMWEKIVLNLLSNAFKYTFEGQIELRLAWAGNKVILSVQDTGVGIPEEYLPALFKRYHRRIPETRSRSYEGCGIGLSLVYELVKLHGGKVGVESIVNKGTTFTVEIPAGQAHLPAAQIKSETEPDSIISNVQLFIDEALSWLPQSEISDVSWHKTAEGGRVRILLAEDNANLRSQVEYFLSPYCDVETVSDGESALAAANRQTPDLILANIKLPKMDGLQLLSALQNKPSLQSTPVVFLGEGVKFEGLQPEATDYLVPPIKKQELLARIKANLNLDLQRISHEVEEAKQLSEARFKQIVDSNIIGVFFGRVQDGLITDANDHVLSLLGYTRADLENDQLNWKRITPPEYAYLDEAMLAQSMGKGFLMPIEKQYFHKKGALIDVLLGAKMLKDSEDEFVCYVLDITERRRAERLLAEYMQRLEQSNRDLEHFATIASHDLQEPLRKIMLFTNHLGKITQVLNEEATDDIVRIQRAAGRMQHLINDLLDLSKISRRGQSFRKVMLEQVIREVIAELSYSYPDIHKRVELNGAMTVEADQYQINQMFVQLLDNALKFQRAEKPTDVKIDIEPLEGNQCQITIADNGIGIKTEHLSKIFDVFVRLHHGQEHAGTGIGLALVKKIVERHSGSITVKSTPGKGSTFTVTLPAFQK